MPMILLVEDEAVVAETVSFNLEREGYSIIVAADGVTALDLARSSTPDLIILDVMLPGLDGFSVCRMVRRDSNVPIIMLSARSNEYDRISGLEMGADDYLTKPFSMGELLARIRAIMRRGAKAAPSSEQEALRIGEVTIDPASRRAFCGGAELKLAQKEFDLLLCLMRNRGLALSRDMLLDRVWGPDFMSDGRTVDVHIRWLREKIEVDPARPRYILTIRGIGYRFVDADEAPPPADSV